MRLTAVKTKEAVRRPESADIGAQAPTTRYFCAPAYAIDINDDLTLVTVSHAATKNLPTLVPIGNVVEMIPAPKVAAATKNKPETAATTQ